MDVSTIVLLVIIGCFGASWVREEDLETAVVKLAPDADTD